jgi:hypothetical protein
VVDASVGDAASDKGGGSIVLAPLVPRYQELGIKHLKYQPWRIFLFSLFLSSYLPVFCPFSRLSSLTQKLNLVPTPGAAEHGA